VVTLAVREVTMSVWQIVGLVFLLVLAGIAVLVLVGLWFWTLDRFRMVGRRRYFETNVIDTQIARVKNDPNATRQAIEELRLLQVVSTAPAPAI
jgi:beta-phosphoglucomutase-like phosphatase (HAD superfamily)